MIKNEAHIVSMAKAIDFIESNLKESINVQSIADSIGYSLFHFSRTFNSIVRFSPYDYLMRRRIVSSAEELLNTNKKIIEIAFDYQFQNHETYTRAFRRVFGVAPKDYRKYSNQKQIVLPYLSLDYLKYINNVIVSKPSIDENVELELVGLMTQSANPEETCKQLKSNLLSFLSEQPEYIYYAIENISENTYIFAGIIHTKQKDSTSLVKKNLSLEKTITIEQNDGLSYLEYTQLYLQNSLLSHPELKMKTGIIIIKEDVQKKTTGLSLPLTV